MRNLTKKCKEERKREIEDKDDPNKEELKGSKDEEDKEEPEESKKT